MVENLALEAKVHYLVLGASALLQRLGSNDCEDEFE